MRFFRRPAFKIFISVIAALVLGSLISVFSHSASSPLNKAVSFVFSPAQNLAAAASRELADLPFSFRSSSVISKERDELQAEVDSLRNQLVDYEDMKRQNELYREFLELKRLHPDQQYCEANIIGRDSLDFASEFTLNRGSIAGIKVQDPVIYGGNLVGVVTSVSPTVCTVKTILDPDVNVSCYEIRTVTTGYVTSTAELGRKGLCHMPNLEGTTAITVGGIVCTSGVGGVYPADLVIGTVQTINDATLDISAAAVIEPAVDFSTLTGVFVITSFENQGAE